MTQEIEKFSNVQALLWMAANLEDLGEEAYEISERLNCGFDTYWAHFDSKKDELNPLQDAVAKIVEAQSLLYKASKLIRGMLGKSPVKLEIPAG